MNSNPPFDPLHHPSSLPHAPYEDPVYDQRMAAQQSAASHAALDPITHFILAPILVITFGLAVFSAIHTWPRHAGTHLWWIVLAVALLLLNIKTRSYALKLQDRIIRLEERIRLTALLPPSELALAQALTTRQLIALRFASDAELAALVARTLAENLEPKQIKQSIATWRSDHARV